MLGSVTQTPKDKHCMLSGLCRPELQNFRFLCLSRSELFVGPLQKPTAEDVTGLRVESAIIAFITQITDKLPPKYAF